MTEGLALDGALHCAADHRDLEGIYVYRNGSLDASKACFTS